MNRSRRAAETGGRLTSPLRVAHVITRLDVGGAQETAVAMCAGFDPAEVKAILVCGPDGGSGGSLRQAAEEAGVEVVVLPELRGPIRPLADRAACLALTRLLRSRQIDVVHTHSSKAGVVGRIAARLAGLPAVHMVHGWSFHDAQRRPVAAVYRAIERLLARWTAAIAVVTHVDRMLGLDAGIGRRHQYAVIRSGIPLDPPMRMVRSVLREREGWSERDVVVISVGRLEPQKDPIGLVDAFARAHRREPRLRLVLVGDGSLRTQVEARAGQLGIGDRIALLGLRFDVAELLAGADLFASAARWEGLPRAVLQAVRARLPVVATDVGGVSEVITDGVSGRLVPPGSPAALAGAIVDLAADVEQSHRLANRAREGLTAFGEPAMVADATALYERVAAQRNGMGAPPAQLSVAHVITGLEVGGAECTVERLSHALRSRGLGQCVVSLTELGPIGERMQAAGFDIHALGLGRRRPDPRDIWRLRRLLRSLEPDVIQTWLYHADLLGGLASWRLGAPVIWNLRQSALDPGGHRSTNALPRIAGPLSTVLPTTIVTNSEQGAGFHASLGYDQDRILVIPNGVDLDRFQPDPSAGQELRTALGIGTDVFLAGFVARFDPTKDHRSLFNAIAQVRSRGVRVELILVGPGCGRDDLAVAQLARSFDLVNAVHLLGLRHDLPRVVAGFDVYVQSSRTEGMPNSLSEAMACGVVSVATDVGDTARLVGDAATLVPAGDPERLADAVAEVLRLAPAVRSARGVRARQQVQEHFGHMVAVDRYEQLYRLTASCGSVNGRSMRRQRRWPPPASGQASP